jgi:hypothetical protein
MAKRIKVKNNPPRGLSKKVRQLYDDAHRSGDHDLKISLDMDKTRDVSSTPSSTRKKLVKEGNRKFIGPRQFSSERSEDRGMSNRNDPRSYRSYHRQLNRELLERDDPTVDAYESGLGQIRGSLSPEVSAKLRAAVRKIMAKPAREMTDRERKFIRTIDSTGHFLGNYDY